MARHVVVVLSEPVAGRAGEFNDWYENTHIDEVLASAGWASGQRFELAAEQGAPCPLRHLALYEVEADDPAEALKRLNESRSQREQSDAFERSSAALWVFSPTGPRHEADA